MYDDSPIAAPCVWLIWLQTLKKGIFYNTTTVFKDLLNSTFKVDFENQLLSNNHNSNLEQHFNKHSVQKRKSLLRNIPKILYKASNNSWLLKSQTYKVLCCQNGSENNNILNNTPPLPSPNIGTALGVRHKKAFNKINGALTLNNPSDKWLRWNWLIRSTYLANKFCRKKHPWFLLSVKVSHTLPNR